MWYFLSIVARVITLVSRPPNSKFSIFLSYFKIGFISEDITKIQFSIQCSGGSSFKSLHQSNLIYLFVLVRKFLTKDLRVLRPFLCNTLIMVYLDTYETLTSLCKSYKFDLGSYTFARTTALSSRVLSFFGLPFLFQLFLVDPVLLNFLITV